MYKFCSILIILKKKRAEGFRNKELIGF